MLGAILQYPVVVAGYGCLTLIAASLVPNIGLRLDWWQYLSLGIVFPFVLLALWRGGFLSSTAGMPFSCRLVGAIPPIGVLSGCIFLWLSKGLFDFIAVLILALVTTGCWIFLYLRRWPAWMRRASGAAAVGFFLSAGMWSSAISLIHWTNLHSFLFQSAYSFLAFGVIVAIIHWAILGPRAESVTHSRSPTLFAWKHVAPFLAICLLSFRTFTFEPVAIHHWSFLTGPVEGVRQGGLFLWNVPSQYGFLNLWLTSSMPWTSSWEALYMLQGALLVAVGICLYFLWYWWRPSMCAVAAIGSLSAVFLVPGRVADLTGPQFYPNSGPMRFLWCYALVTIFFVWCQWGGTTERRTIAKVAGIPWILGVLWSAESGIYTSAIYFASLVTLMAQEVRSDRNSTGCNALKVGGHVLRFLSAPVAYLGVACFAVSLFYYLKLGRLPDMVSYVEYGLIYVGGFMAWPIDPRGPVWLFFAVFCACATAVVMELNRDPSGRGVVLGVALTACIWSVGSYYVFRAHPYVLLSLCPILFLAIWIILIRSSYWDEQGPSNFSSTLLKIAFVPIVVMMLSTALVNPKFPGKFTAMISNGLFGMNCASLLPVADEDLQRLIDQAHLSPNDPISFYDEGSDTVPRWRDANGSLVLSSRSWLPKPLKMFFLLSEERQKLYVDRFLTPEILPGWFILGLPQKGPNEALMPTSVMRLLPSWVRITLAGENRRWRLIRVEVSPASRD